MKKFFLILSAIFAMAFTSQAQTKTLVSAVTAATPLTLLTGGKYTITEFVFQNAGTNTGTIYFYDSASNSTNYVQGAYTSYTQYATNITSTFTNTAGIIITNVFPGVYTSSATVSASTNERPYIIGPIALTGSAATLVEPTPVAPALGLTVYTTAAAGTLQVTYRETNP